MNRKTKKNIKIIISTIVLIIAIVIGFIEGIEEKTNVNNPEDLNINNFQEELKVYFIDVGQADSILIINKDKSMLIDAGNNEDGQLVVNFIKDKGISKLDYLVGTHPHEDHIGGLDDVIDNFDIGNIYMPKVQTNTKTFEDVLDSIQNKNLKVTSPNKGDTFNVGDARCEIVNDSIINEKNLNLSSIIVKLTFGNNQFLFTGDAEKENEKELNLSEIDVLKVGHHGSNTSSSMDFLSQIKPDYSIIMVGENNSYKLPKKEIIDRLNQIGSKIYRTDENGTIEIISDGRKISINTEK